MRRLGHQIPADGEQQADDGDTSEQIRQFALQETIQQDKRQQFKNRRQEHGAADRKLRPAEIRHE
ncbi:hypothetical protein D3C71_2179810 [compost metagenome]